MCNEEQAHMAEIIKRMRSHGAYFPLDDDCDNLERLGWTVTEKWLSCVLGDDIEVMIVTSPGGLTWEF